MKPFLQGFFRQIYIQTLQVLRLRGVETVRACRHIQALGKDNWKHNRRQNMSKTKIILMSDIHYHCADYFGRGQEETMASLKEPYAFAWRHFSTCAALICVIWGLVLCDIAVYSGNNLATTLS